MSKQDIAVRFARETAEHQMLILHDDGLYRHVRFRHPKRSAYWFELITTPGTLIFRGDGESYVFNREPDMFEWFRTSAWKGRPNLGYWAEKMTSSRDTIKRYDQDLLAAEVCRTVDECYDYKPMPDGLREAVQENVLDELVGHEDTDRQTVDSFAFYINEKDRFDPFADPDFRFHDVWEWRTQDYDWWFEWACQAIVWGINQYNAAKARKRLSDRRLKVGRLAVYVEPRDGWVGGFVADGAVYVLPLPFLVFRWQRKTKLVKPLDCTPLALTAAEKARSENDRVWGTAPRVVDVQLPEPAEVPA